MKEPNPLLIVALILTRFCRENPKMATRILSRSILNTKKCLSSVYSCSYASFSIKSSPSALASLPSFSSLRLSPLVSVAANFHHLSPAAATICGFATRQTTSSHNDSNSNWSNRPPKETILLNDCDFEHWLVVVEKPEAEPLRDEIIDSYIKTLAKVIGRVAMFSLLPDTVKVETCGGRRMSSLVAAYPNSVKKEKLLEPSDLSIAYDTETATKVIKSRNSSKIAESGGFVLWQMNLDMWYVELVLSGSKVHAGFNES